jgi:hypothetical protein
MESYFLAGAFSEIEADAFSRPKSGQSIEQSWSMYADENEI